MDMAEAAGAPKGAGWDANSRLPLGTAEVSPLAQASAYATFANEGVAVPSHVVREVRDAKGKIIYKAKVEEKRAVSSDVAADVTYALSSVVDGGTGRAAQALNIPVAGKTGTKDREDDIVSAWFVGMTTQVSTAVMYVAGDSGTDDLDPYARPGDSTFFGGTYPALTWADYMAVATKGQPVEDFPEPAYVNRDGEPEPTTQSEPTDEPTETAEPTPTDEPTRTPTATQPTAEPSESSSAPPTTEPPTTRRDHNPARSDPSPTRSRPRRPHDRAMVRPPAATPNASAPGSTALPLAFAVPRWQTRVQTPRRPSFPISRRQTGRVTSVATSEQAKQQASPDLAWRTRPR